MSSGRKLNALEQVLHQAALADPKMVSGLVSLLIVELTIDFVSCQTLTMKDAEGLAPDAAARTQALNFLLGTVNIEVGYFRGADDKFP